MYDIHTYFERQNHRFFIEMKMMTNLKNFYLKFYILNDILQNIIIL